MARGDHIRAYRKLYWHHGIDIGDGTVIHLAGEPGHSTGALVLRSSMTEFLRGNVAETVIHHKTLPPDRVIERAQSRLGESGYHLLSNNCEHFARWCVGRSNASRQVESAAWQGAAAGLLVRHTAAQVLKRSAPTIARRLASVLGPVGTTIALTGAVIGCISRVRAQTGKPRFEGHDHEESPPTPSTCFKGSCSTPFEAM